MRYKEVIVILMLFLQILKHEWESWRNAEKTEPSELDEEIENDEKECIARLEFGFLLLSKFFKLSKLLSE